MSDLVAIYEAADVNDVREILEISLKQERCPQIFPSHPSRIESDNSRRGQENGYPIN